LNQTVIAITGASGFIGTRLVDHFLAGGHRVRILIHRNDLDRDVEKFRGSLFDSRVLSRFLGGVDVLFHLASALGNHVLPESEFFRINRDGTEAVLGAAAENRVGKVVHFSSAGVYGRSSGRIPLKESAELHPVDAYERSKMEGEREAIALSRRIDVSVIRPGWVYGEGDRRTFKLIRQIQSRIFFIAGSGKIMHSPIHVDDLAKLADIIAHRGGRGEIYNGGGDPLAVRTMVDIIATSLKRNILPVRVPLALLEPPAFMLERLFALWNRESFLNSSRLAFFKRGKPLDISKVREEFGFRPEFDFRHGIELAIAWYRSNGWL
jgi:nucleoside-diphosphate-sugar epimerase